MNCHHIDQQCCDSDRSRVGRSQDEPKAGSRCVEFPESNPPSLFLHGTEPEETMQICCRESAGIVSDQRMANRSMDRI